MSTLSLRHASRVALITVPAVLFATCAAILPPSAPPQGPLSSAEFAELQRSAMFGDEDVRYLRMSRAVLEPQIDEILDLWYGFVGSQPHLLASFANPDGEPIPDYLAAVRQRFGRWILTTADAQFDDDWLAAQHEIGLRHHRAKKNRTDGVDAAPHIRLRHVVALTYPITHTLRPFLAAGDHSHTAEAIDKMHQAWTKAVLLQVTLWSKPYVKPGDF
ncbi:MAG: protoglobin domain-containing protein [Planctomycetota bacterium]